MFGSEDFTWQAINCLKAVGCKRITGAFLSLAKDGSFFRARCTPTNSTLKHSRTAPESRAFSDRMQQTVFSAHP